ncbi:HET-domain-containing protein, partial [Thozetella sp. PMI_491]
MDASRPIPIRVVSAYDRIAPPLCPSNREIRLLEVLPGKGDDKLQGRLSKISLDSHPVPIFTALSYTWGSLKNAEKMYFGEDILPVTKNLSSALRRIRGQSTITILWVDAICINQSSIEEKNTQIPLMRFVYSLAIRVVVWLGESTSVSEMAIRSLEV